MRSNLVLTVFVSFLMTLPVFGATEPPAVITFPAKNGDIRFNHKKHVDGNRNCNTCHDRKKGKIKGLGKEWAHKVCMGCHEAIMQGPVTCEGCHKGAAK